MALNNVPLSGQSLNDTRNPIRNNFNTIDTAFTVDHVSYNTANQGFHNKVTMPVQALAPVFAAGINGLFSLLNATTTQNEINIHKQNLAGAVNIPMTASVLGTNAINNGVRGWTYLPSGILLKWGATSSAAATNIDTFSGGPAYTAVYNAQATLFNNSPGSWYISFTAAPNPTIQVNGLGAGAQYYYFIIGA